MARWCPRCNRPLDPEHHDVELVEVERPSGLTVKEPQKVLEPYRRGRGRVGFRKRTAYGCRTRLISRSPVSGNVLPTDHPQRIKELKTAHVHESRLKPGGDLHA